MSDPKAALKQYSELLIQRAGVVELRALRVGPKRKNYSGFFNNADALATWASRYSGSAEGIYTTLNKIDDSLFLGDGPQKISNQTGYSMRGSSAEDQHMVRRLWLPMDFDPAGKVRPSSHGELVAAGEAATQFYEWLKSEGWPEPTVRGMSGNGVHLLYAVDLPVTEEINSAVRRLFLRCAWHAWQHIKKNTKFDSVNYNLGRIWKIYGTLTTKGEEKGDRTHRTATCQIADKMEIVPLELIMELAGEAGTEDRWRIPDKDGTLLKNREPGRSRKAVDRGDYGTLDVAAWFQSKGMYRYEMSGGKHSVYCPWASDHSSKQSPSDNDTIVWEPTPDNQDKMRWPVFHCSHNSCNNPKKDFDDVRELWGDADDYCTSEFDKEAFKKSLPVESLEDMETYSMDDSQIVEELNGLKSRMGLKRNVSCPAGNDSPSMEVPPKRSRLKFTASTASVFDGKRAELPGTEYDEIIEDLDEVISANSDLNEESAPPLGSRPGDDDNNDNSRQGDDPPGGDDGDGPTGFPIFNHKSDYNDRDHVLENLVLIEGTSMIYHIGWKRLMNRSEVTLNFPGKGKQWLGMENNRLSVAFADFVFDPEMWLNRKDHPSVLNRFTGMPVLTGPSCSPSLVEDHLAFICGGDAELYDYFLRWLAYPIQYPGFKLPTAPVIQGPPGSGKNIFFDAFSGMVYDRYAHQAGSQDLSSRFNAFMLDKLWLTWNEIHTSRGHNDVKNKLKAYITDRTINIEQKGKDPFPQKNCMNMVFLSNEDTPLTIEHGDRRYWVIEMQEVKPKQYYTKLAEGIRSGAMRGFIEKLQVMDLSNWNPHQHPPETEAKREAIDTRGDAG
jgi:hypothetical protein